MTKVAAIVCVPSPTCDGVTVAVQSDTPGVIVAASVHVVNNSLMFFRFESFFPWWNAIRSFSSDVAMLLWCVALWKPARWTNKLIAAAQNAVILGLLFFSRVVDGLTGGNLTVAQAYITDVTDAKDRSKGLGMIGAAFGLGFIIGPVTGGLLSQYGSSCPVYELYLIS